MRPSVAMTRWKINIESYDPTRSWVVTASEQTVVEADTIKKAEALANARLPKDRKAYVVGRED
jgi:hypothetical protein